MDCFSVESEFIESLDFLSPPVKRLQNSREAFGSAFYNEPSNVHLLRGLRNKFSRRSHNSPKSSRIINIKQSVDSSTSLILKKTSERKILEHYSVLSYTSLQHPPDDNVGKLAKPDAKQDSSEKPLIKVTVIPRTDHVQTAKLLRKRRYIPKRVSSTTSNQENSVQTKNVYLIVAGRRREKIYEIKTTGSTKFSTDHDSHVKDDELPIKELSNFKHLIESLNMDRKKKKTKKGHVNSDAPQQTSLEWKGYPECENCFCAQTMPEEPDSQSPQKSRIKIFGQFGISEDDKYVLRYGASVNDKQVLSDVAQLTRDFSPIAPFGPFPKCTSSIDEDPSPQKESGTQADYDNDLIFEVATKDTIPSKESQGTQVNFNVQVATMTKEKTSRFSDKKIQCTCCAAQSSNKMDHKVLKDCQSPLVIISVYPKQCPDDSGMEESVLMPKELLCPSPPHMSTYTSSQVIKTDKSSKKPASDSNKKHNRPSARSRSPSPTKKPSRGKMPEDKIIENRLNKSHTNDRKSAERQSPDRKALKAIKDKIHEKDKLKQDAGTRKPSKFNATSATQAGKHAQVAVSNATQVSNKNHIVASNATQVSARNRQNFTVSNATQVKSPPNIALVKHNNVQTVITPTKHPQMANMSNATQATKSTKRIVATNATQISKNEYFTSNNATQVSKNRPSSNSPRRFRNQETFTAPAKVYKNEQTSETRPLQERGTNTDHARTKKALVETYTKKLTEQMNQKDYFPARYDSSKITINIDGDKEYYDVLFNQDKQSTDLTVRKTLKDMSSQKGLEEEPSVSLENLLYMPSDEAKCIISGNKSPEKSLSIALYNNVSHNNGCKDQSSILIDRRSDDETPLTKHVSRFSIRDSLEISHRREDKSNHNSNNIKNTQTCFTAQLTETIPDETEFLAPIKHYTGDDCSICDPIERDKQIRELLGVEKSKFGSSKTLQGFNSTIDEHYPFQCFYRQECKKSQVTEINFEFQKLCPCFKHPKTKTFQNTSVQVRPNLVSTRNMKHDTYCSPSGNTKESKGSKQSKQSKASKQSKVSKQSKGQQKSDDHDCCIADICPNYDMYDNDEGEDNVHVKYDYAIGNENKDITFDSQNQSSIYQQLILNRNIQVFLQVEQFSKQKPIVLSRKQYDKVKKTIQKTICKEKKSNHDKRKKICHKCVRSEVSVGAIRTKNEKKVQPSNKHTDQEAQTELPHYDHTSGKRETRKSLNKRKQSKRVSSEHSEDFSGDGPMDHHRKTIHNKHHHQKRGRSISRDSEAIALKPRDLNVKLLSNESSYTTTRSNYSRKSRTRHRTKSDDKHKHIAVDATGHKHLDHGTPAETQSSEEDCGCCTPIRCEELENEMLAKWKRELTPEHSPDHKRDHSPERHKDRKRLRDENSEDIEVERRIEHYDDADKLCCHQAEIKTMVLYNADDAKAESVNCKQTGIDTPPRKTMSSVEVRYASVAYMKQVAYSSTDMGALSNSSLPHINSFQTIFRGHRKSPTPNLGTSAYSLYSDDGLPSENKSAKFLMEPRDSKPKKPFLRRLMSCLVMRSTRNSDLKLPTGPAPDLPSVNSSIDSYHISTSFGAVEVSSSIYDTSASFYSNHTILPVNSKIKRGFFSSVRGFLTNRKS